MKENNSIETTNSSEWFDATLVDEKPSRLSGLIYVWFFVIMIFAVVAYGSVETWALGFLSIFTCILALLWVADSFFSQQLRFSTNMLQIPLLGLILIGIVQLLPLRNAGISTELLSIPASTALSLDPNITRLAVVQLVIYSIFFAAVLGYVNSQKRLRRTAYTIIIFGACWAFFGILQWLTQLSGQDQFIYGIRKVENAFPFASFINKHHFAAFMEMTIGLSLSLLFTESAKRDKLLLLLIAVLVMGSGALLTGSRGGVVSMLTVIGFVGFFHLFLKPTHQHENDNSRSTLKNKLLIVGGSVVLIFLLFGFAIFLGGDQAILRGTGIEKPEDVSTGRFHFWQVALQIIKDNPIIGTGLDSFGVVFTKYDTWNGSMRVEQAHNDYLQIFTDAGVLGFVCVIAFIVILFGKSLRLINKSNDRLRRGIAIGALGGCFGVLVHSFFDFPLRTPSNAFFFLALAALATASINYPKFYRKS